MIGPRVGSLRKEIARFDFPALGYQRPFVLGVIMLTTG
jgi:hypothetical protein